MEKRNLTIRQVITWDDKEYEYELRVYGLGCSLHRNGNWVGYIPEEVINHASKYQKKIING